MKYVTKENIKKVIYDHWKAVLPTILPFLGVAFLSFWDYFRDLMLKPIPFFVLFIFLIVAGSLASWNFVLRSNLKKIKRERLSNSKFILNNNLLYKKDGEGPYCPTCYERDNKVSRMKENPVSLGKTRYKCFVCNYVELVHDESQEIPEDIPF